MRLKNVEGLNNNNNNKRGNKNKRGNGKKELFTVTSLIPRHPSLYFASLDIIDNISVTKLVLDCNFLILNLHIQLQVS